MDQIRQKLLVKAFQMSIIKLSQDWNSHKIKELEIEFKSFYNVNIICSSYFKKEKINEKIILEKLENMYL